MKLELVLSFALVALSQAAAAQTTREPARALQTRAHAIAPVSPATGVRTTGAGAATVAPVTGVNKAVPMIPGATPAAGVPASSPPPGQTDGNGRKVCRVEGATVFYCM
ncbi:MAG: hypothetical protein KGM46_02860 [Pseudomonadota bacterium]|jgi:hypothetical protein|nr:hypothetical protein [Xanthomonadaceae bacterium]MDE2249515.1 hypothetical protein [Xanthomonadaceae bacterium]MDE3209662.1 hypothetical protein [Pseudomonadota bacterium]